MKHMAGISNVNAVRRKGRIRQTISQRNVLQLWKGRTLHKGSALSSMQKARKVLAIRCIYGHFAVCCRTLDWHASETGRVLRPKNNSGNHKAFRTPTNQVEDHVAGSIQEKENPAFAFPVMQENEEGVCKVSTARQVPTMNVSIN